MSGTDSVRDGHWASDSAGRSSAREPTTRPGRGRRRRWIISVLVALSVLVGAFLVQAATPASAYVGTNFVRNKQTGRCLDGYDAGGANTRVYTHDCQVGNAYQQWLPIFLYHGATDVVAFQNVATLKCMMVSYGNTHAITVDGQNCTGPTVYTHWAAVGSWQDLQIVATISGSCLDSNEGGSVYMLGCNGGLYQRWQFGL